MSAPGADRSGTRLRPPEAEWAAPPAADRDTVARLADGLSLPGTFCAVLAARGLADVEEAKRFLRPRLEHLHDPGLLADGERAARRIADAIDAGERILVHGDYDVDGICATALLTRWLGGLGADVIPFVPHRLRDGYDLSDSGVARAREAGAGLVVTVDCGTVAHGPVEAAAREGIDVIVTDHHTVAGRLPAAVAVVNPQRPDCAYPDPGLCGTGVALKVAQLVGRLRGADPEGIFSFLDLVALATVADLVPLRGENRVLVHYGLRRFAASHVAGVGALLDVCGVAAADVTSGRLGYVVAPRINAAGRLGDADDGLRLLLTDDDGEARSLAARLDELNGRRRDEDRRTLDEALEMLEATYDPERDFGVVLASEGWHPGVIGIVASRVVERIHRPTVLVALEGGRGRGSARSVPGFHLYEAVAECSEHLGRFGGHRQAAGMDVSADAVEAFRAAFNDAARRRLDAATLRPTLRPDLELRLAEVDLDLVRWMEYLGPHGIGNPGPLFLARAVAVRDPRVVGEAHLKVSLGHDGGAVDAIGFGLAERFEVAELGRAPHDLLFRLERNEWRGQVRAQAKLVDLRRSSA